ncbi:MAG: hypothetical protein JWN04_2460, partial [Myxococcaceae bacterium]|nr:hypothetical protein [Myxococcaceae bacterium]
GPVLIGLLAFLMALSGWLALKWKKFQGSRAASKAAKRGLKAEKEAEKVLKKLGYTLLQRQPPGSYWAIVDGESKEVKLNADLLVELRGKSFIAEVKTGAAAKFEHAETRRQLLEYRNAFGVDGLLLVDMESRAVRTVVFPAPKPPATAIAAKRTARRWVAVAAVTLAAVWFLSRSSEHHAAAGSADEDVVEHEPVLDNHSDKPAAPIEPAHRQHP